MLDVIEYYTVGAFFELITLPSRILDYFWVTRVNQWRVNTHYFYRKTINGIVFISTKIGWSYLCAVALRDARDQSEIYTEVTEAVIQEMQLELLELESNNG